MFAKGQYPSERSKMSNSKNLFPCLTHTASDETKLKYNLIECVAYNERQKDDNLTAFLHDIMAEWNTAGYTTAIASDNAENITAAIRDTGRWHIPCFTHSINLVMQGALTPLFEMLVKVKSIVEIFKRSSHDQHKLREMQKQLNLGELKLKHDVPKRWNSTYDMLQRLLSAKDAVIATTAVMRQELALNYDDWGVIEGAAAFFKTFLRHHRRNKCREECFAG
ncbi:unnamed protein product [Euphydryas editha]|uniref:Transposase n=1 Tax=Euphydryas editha TaxID=104508 RepID=A0AAU9TNK7_EUPED|nr:unnamed protein product [Euphydryas editha]